MVGSVEEKDSMVVLCRDGGGGVAGRSKIRTWILKVFRCRNFSNNHNLVILCFDF